MFDENVDLFAVSDSGSYTSSHSSLNRESGPHHHHHHHGRHHDHVTSQCNGAGDGTDADYMVERSPDDDATADDQLYTEYDTSLCITH